MAGARRRQFGFAVFIFGIALFVLGAWLVHELILKFLKFAVGLLLIFISLPMIFGSIGWMKFGPRKGRVVRFYKGGSQAGGTGSQHTHRGGHHD